MPRRKNTRSNYSLLWIMALAVVILILAILNNKNDPADGFVTQHSVPFNVLVPNHLPQGSSFKPDLSTYDATTQKVCLAWVYPAQTMPGQGTVIVCEQPTSKDDALPEIKDSKNIEVTYSDNSYQGVIGVVSRGDGVPDQPGQRALKVSLGNVRVSIVAYAITDDELQKIATSLQR